MPLLEVDHVSKEFGGLLATNDVSFNVNNGEIVCIIGPNGAGKTTIFNIITGVYKINKVKIVFDEKNITNLKPRKIVESGISRTFQNIRLFSGLRVIDNVLIGDHLSTNYSFINLLLRDKKFKSEETKAYQKALEILESIDLGDCIEAYAGDLPYGKQRRLEIARAIATGAKLLLLDEPAAGMNPQESDDLMKFVLNLRDRGYTILMIEHDMQMVMNISDRIYVMNYGKVIANGTPKDIVSNKEVIHAYLGESEDDE